MDQVDADGFPASEVGAWTLEKHELLRKYVDSSRAARRKYKSRSYIDLYSGPGRSWIRETGQFIDGSPLVAFEAAARSDAQFSQIIVSDANPEYVLAAEKRLRSRGANVQALTGETASTVEKLATILDPQGLHFAFLDPYNLGALPFSIIEKLARFKRMDLLIHVSAMDLKRDLHNYVRTGGQNDLDRFAPSWRKRVDITQRAELVRQGIFEHWRSLIRELGTSPNDCIEAVENSKGAVLYWLVFVARHDLAHKLWKEISNISGQGNLF